MSTLLEQLLKQIDDSMLSKTRKSMNSKNIKKRPGVAEVVSESEDDYDLNPPVAFSNSHRNPYFIDSEQEEQESQDNNDFDFDFDKDQDTDDDHSSDEEGSQDAPLENKDPNRQGVIRVVDGAHLVYKRQDEESSYSELWIFNIGDKLEDELKIKRAILAGTDIPANRTKSEDDTQKYTLVTMGNAQLLNITGLPQ